MYFLRCTVGLCVVFISSAAAADEFSFRIQEIEAGLGVGYGVRVADVNADGRPDIIVVDTTRILWYENPTWQRHVVGDGQTEPDNVCLAAADIDGDGRLDFAVGASWKPFQPVGTLQWFRQPEQIDDPWPRQTIADDVASVHRIDWADIDGDGKGELVVVPLMGRGAAAPDWNQAAVRIAAYHPAEGDPAGMWREEVLHEELHVCHNFELTDVDRDGWLDAVVASFEGVTRLSRQETGQWTPTLLGTGNQATAPNRGASEIKHGLLSKESEYLATIEPWHGHQVVVYTPPGVMPANWPRHVLDEDLKWGHAVCCANLDQDADEELIVGVRDTLSEQAPCGVRVYDPENAAAGRWRRQLVDAGGVAVEDLTAADLNGDGRTDLIAAGRATKNVRIYWNE